MTKVKMKPFRVSKTEFKQNTEYGFLLKSNFNKSLSNEAFHITTYDLWLQFVRRD